MAKFTRKYRKTEIKGTFFSQKIMSILQPFRFATEKISNQIGQISESLLEGSVFSTTKFQFSHKLPKT